MTYISRLELRHHKLILYSVDPKCGRHQRHICIRIVGPLIRRQLSLQKRNVIRSATRQRRRRSGRYLKAMLLVIFEPSFACRSTVFGSERISCVIVPVAMKFVRSCGMRGVSTFVAIWLANGIPLFICVPPMLNGVMSSTKINGGPGKGAIGSRHCALTVVPCGMDAMRLSVAPTTGLLLVAGTCIQRPGSA